MTYGSGLEFSWRGFRFFSLSLSLIRFGHGAWQGSNSKGSLSLYILNTISFYSTHIHTSSVFFKPVFFFLLFILFVSLFFPFSIFSVSFLFSVWFTSAGNPTRTARWTVQCPLRVRPCATATHSKWADGEEDPKKEGVVVVIVVIVIVVMVVMLQSELQREKEREREGLGVYTARRWSACRFRMAL